MLPKPVQYWSNYSLLCLLDVTDASLLPALYQVMAGTGTDIMTD